MDSRKGEGKETRNSTGPWGQGTCPLSPGSARPFWSPRTRELPLVTHWATPGGAAAPESQVTRVGPQPSAAKWATVTSALLQGALGVVAARAPVTSGSAMVVPPSLGVLEISQWDGATSMRPPPAHSPQAAPRLCSPTFRVKGQFGGPQGLCPSPCRV